VSSILFVIVTRIPNCECSMVNFNDKKYNEFENQRTKSQVQPQKFLESESEFSEFKNFQNDHFKIIIIINKDI